MGWRSWAGSGANAQSEDEVEVSHDCPLAARSGCGAFGRWLLANARESLKERGVEIRLDIDPQRFL